MIVEKTDIFQKWINTLKDSKDKSTQSSDIEKAIKMAEEIV